MSRIAAILGQLTDPDLDWMVGAGRALKIGVGEVVIGQGKPIPSLFVVLEGRFSIYGAAGDNDTRPAELLGEVSFIDGIPPAADVLASEDSLVLSIPHDALRERLAKDDAFAARFYRAVALMLTHRLRNAAAAATGCAQPSAAPEEDDPAGREALARAAQRFDALIERLRRSA